MEEYFWDRRSERRVRLSEAAENMVETPGMRVRGLSCVGGSVGVWRVGTVLLLVLLLAVLLAARADAKPQIKVNCDVYAENYVDPIAFASHLHRQIGNTSTTNSSTGDSLFNNPSTSCDESWFTSAGWFPVERNESVKGVNVYYRAPGDPTKIKAIPKGLQLLATKQSRQRERRKVQLQRRTVSEYPALRL